MILYYAVWWDPVCFRFRLNCPPKVLGALGLSEAITSSSSYRLAQRRIKGLWPVVANIFFGVNGLYMFMEGLPWAWALYRSWITVHEFQWVFKILLGFDFGSFHRALCFKKQFVDLCHWNLHTHTAPGVSWFHWSTPVGFLPVLRQLHFPVGDGSFDLGGSIWCWFFFSGPLFTIWRSSWKCWLNLNYCTYVHLYYISLYMFFK